MLTAGREPIIDVLPGLTYDSNLENVMNILEMTHAECIDLLSLERIGRLACCKDDAPYVVPITFTLDSNHLYSFSLTGQKIEWMRANPVVCVLVDRLTAHGDWSSVIVYGRFEELPDQIGTKHTRERAWSLLSTHANWWEPGAVKPVSRAPTPHLFYRIKIESLTGRRAIQD